MKKVVIVFGGVSPEHEVSIASAKGIWENIDREKFEVSLIKIDKSGKWWWVNDFEMERGDKVIFEELSTNVDVVFPVLHGEGGEDGSIQGLLEVLGIKYVGCDILSSAVCLDKAVFNQLMVANGIDKPNFVILDKIWDSQEDQKVKIEEVVQELQWPVFVKPDRTGSSVGISKVKDVNKLDEALKKAWQFDKKIVIEESVEEAKEIEVSVLGNGNNDIEVSLPGRVLPANEFYDYEDKYLAGQTGFEIPVVLEKELEIKIREIARRAFKIANCRGLARVDFLLDKNNQVFLNEINTMPGFTPISMYPKLWEATGLNYKDLITKLIELAVGEKNREI